MIDLYRWRVCFQETHRERLQMSPFFRMLSADSELDSIKFKKWWLFGGGEKGSDTKDSEICVQTKKRGKHLQES